MTLKRTQVIMLPTKGRTLKSECDCNNEHGNHHYHCGLREQSRNLYLNGDLVHLYLCSDDEIREGDCCYDNGTIYKIKDKKHLLVVLNFSNAKKIIATTDSSLTTGLNNCDGCLAGKLVDIHGYHAMGENGKHLDLMICQKDKYIKCLPQPSEDFIRVYVEAYNKNDIIKYVDVEYDIYYKDGYGNWLSYNKEFWDKQGYKPKFGTKNQLKVNSKNEISIRKTKDTWTRDEVIALIKEFDNSIRTVREDEISYRNKWIENNL